MVDPGGWTVGPAERVMGRRAFSLLISSLSWMWLGCASSPDLAQFAPACRPLPRSGQGAAFGVVRATFVSTAPVSGLVLQLVSVQERCTRYMSTLPDGTRELISLAPGEYVLSAFGPGSSLIEPMRFYLGR